MAEETKDPVRTFPKILLLGLFITGHDLSAGLGLRYHACAARASSAKARRRC